MRCSGNTRLRPSQYARRRVRAGQHAAFITCFARRASGHGEGSLNGGPFYSWAESPKSLGFLRLLHGIFLRLRFRTLYGKFLAFESRPLEALHVGRYSGTLPD